MSQNSFPKALSYLDRLSGYVYKDCLCANLHRNLLFF
jgi:hypothetical protein